MGLVRAWHGPASVLLDTADSGSGAFGSRNARNGMVRPAGDQFTVSHGQLGRPWPSSLSSTRAGRIGFWIAF